MALEPIDQRLIAGLAEGLALVPRPYAALGRSIGLSESETIARLGNLIGQGVIQRLGVIVRHHELGYRANAMVVWDVADAAVAMAGRSLAGLPFVSLCYQRPRRPPEWSYNLFCMIHGRVRVEVEALIERATDQAGLGSCPRAVLFSRRRFKQQGARYPGGPAVARAIEMAR